MGYYRKGGLSEIMEKPPDRSLYGVGVRIIKYVSRLKIARVKPQALISSRHQIHGIADSVIIEL